MDRTALGRSIQPLEREGLIRTEQIASDLRAKELHLTKAGEKRLQEALGAWSQARDRFEKSFGADRSAELRQLHALVYDKLAAVQFTSDSAICLPEEVSTQTPEENSG